MEAVCFSRTLLSMCQNAMDYKAEDQNIKFHCHKKPPFHVTYYNVSLFILQTYDLHSLESNCVDTKNFMT